MSRTERKTRLLNTPLGRLGATITLGGAIMSGVGAYKSLDIYEDVQSQANVIVSTYPAIAEPTVQAAQTEIAIFETRLYKEIPEKIATEKPSEITISVPKGLPEAYNVVAYEEKRKEVSTIPADGTYPFFTVMGIGILGFGLKVLYDTSKLK